MKALIAGLLLVVACDHDIEMFPVNPGGGGGTSGTGFIDAGISDGDAGDAGNTINGRVCRLLDPRQPTNCQNSGTDGITVTLGNSVATTDVDGSFTIARPTGSNLVWRVDGAAVFPSAMSFGTLTTIPAIDINEYNTMTVTSEAIPPDGDGQIMVQVQRNNLPLSGVTATTTPQPDQGVSILYDTNDPENWQGDTATGQFGMIWVPGVLADSAQVVLQDPALALSQITGIPLFPNTVTFVFADFP